MFVYCKCKLYYLLNLYFKYKFYGNISSGIEVSDAVDVRKTSASKYVIFDSTVTS